MRESFVFYRSFDEALDALPPEQYKRVVQAISKYSLDGIEPSLEGIEKSLFILIRPQLDANNKRFENGKHGGRKPSNNQERTEPEPNYNQDVTKSEPNPNQERTEPEPNANVNVNVNVNENVNDNEQQTMFVAAESPSASPPVKKKFVKPKLEEVESYCAERGNSIDAQSFLDFYESKGWKVGQTPMKDWRAAVRTWEKRDYGNPRSPPNPYDEIYQQFLKEEAQRGSA